jgi:hypothetical protein
MARYADIAVIRLLWRVGAIDMGRHDRVVVRLCLESAKARREIERALRERMTPPVEPVFEFGNGRVTLAQMDGVP